jgi:hypothetical protein
LRIETERKEQPKQNYQAKPEQRKKYSKFHKEPCFTQYLYTFLSTESWISPPNKSFALNLTSETKGFPNFTSHFIEIKVSRTQETIATSFQEIRVTK